jgi:hypothetical protein
LKLDIALLGDRRLLDGDHLPLHVGKFGGCLLIASYEERGRAASIALKKNLMVSARFPPI